MKPKISMKNRKSYYKKELTFSSSKSFVRNFIIEIQDVEDLKNEDFYIHIMLYFTHEKESNEEYLNHIKLNIDLYYNLRKVLSSDLLNDYFQQSENINLYDERNEFNTTYGEHRVSKDNFSFVAFKLEKKKHFYGYNCLTDDQFNWLWFIIHEYISRHMKSGTKNSRSRYMNAILKNKV